MRQCRARVAEREAEALPRRYVELLGDVYTQKILAFTHVKPKDVREISIFCEIPVALCYRRVHLLVSLGLLECVGRRLTRRAKWVRLYKSRVRELDVSFQRARVQVNIEFTDSETFTGCWRVLD